MTSITNRTLSKATGVAISTTGDEHRMGFLETSVISWQNSLPKGSPVVVTIDGDEDAVCRVVQRMDYLERQGAIVKPVPVFRVGQPNEGWNSPFGMRDGKLGVAANKNTGIEFLHEQSDAAAYFLSDDDTWPLNTDALASHVDLGLPHSMLAWGQQRVSDIRSVNGVGFSEWSWPRGSVLYIEREVIDTVGGMDERFGPGGHEHVEFSDRVHRFGLTPAAYCAPICYAHDGPNGPASGAATQWHAEDMIKSGEWLAALLRRRRRITSVRREPGDWAKIEEILADRLGKTEVVSYHAADWGRKSGTLAWT